MRYHGTLYRALNPVYASEPLSGRGAALHGGRFNPRGMPALYCSLAIMTAVREANQVGTLQPTTLVAYEARIDAVFDCRDDEALAAQRFDPRLLTDESWRDQMRLRGEAPTQSFARSLSGQGYQGLLVRSFARGAGPEDLNLVLWSWGKDAPSRLVLIDDQGRLEQSNPQKV
jgi:RES domain-containing protein